MDIIDLCSSSDDDVAPVARTALHDRDPNTLNAAPGTKRAKHEHAASGSGLGGGGGGGLGDGGGGGGAGDDDDSD